MTLLFIAKHQGREGGVSTKDLTTLGMNTTTASRNSYYWGEGLAGQPLTGFGLVSIKIDPNDRRRRN